MNFSSRPVLLLVVVLMVCLVFLSMFFQGRQKKEYFKGFLGVVPGRILVASNYTISGEDADEKCGAFFGGNDSANVEYSYCFIENFAPESAREPCLLEHGYVVHLISKSEFDLAFLPAKPPLFPECNARLEEVSNFTG